VNASNAAWATDRDVSAAAVVVVGMQSTCLNAYRSPHRSYKSNCE